MTVDLPPPPPHQRPHPDDRNKPLFISSPASHPGNPHPTPTLSSNRPTFHSADHHSANTQTPVSHSIHTHGLQPTLNCAQPTPTSTGETCITHQHADKNHRAGDPTAYTCPCLSLIPPPPPHHPRIEVLPTITSTSPLRAKDGTSQKLQPC